MPDSFPGCLTDYLESQIAEQLFTLLISVLQIDAIVREFATDRIILSFFFETRRIESQSDVILNNIICVINCFSYDFLAGFSGAVNFKYRVMGTRNLRRIPAGKRNVK